MLKKGILPLILIVLIIVSLPGNAFASSEVSPMEVYAMVDGQHINAKAVDGTTYLFLPGSVELNALEIHGISEGETPPLLIMTGSDIPTIYINSSNRENEGREFVDSSKSNRTTGRMLMTATNGESLYNGELTQIRARGNSTFDYADKKSYQIKLDKKTDLLGNGEKVKTWVLLAGYNDATKIRDKTLKDLATSIGLPYVASSTWVTLYYDEEYRGIYLLSEKNQVNKTSVNITDMEEAYEEVNEGYGKDCVIATGTNRYGQSYQYTQGLMEPEDVSGGYLIEMNGTLIDEASGFFTRRGRAMNVKSPEWAGEETMRYISEFYQEFEDAVYATDAMGKYTGYNITTGKYYYDYVDKDSLVRTFMMRELSKNPDDFHFSTFMYKDKGSDKLFFGPIWDQEMTLGTSWGFLQPPDSNKRNYLEIALIQIPDFYSAVKEYYNETFADRAKALLDEDGAFALNSALIKESVEMDHVLWPYVKTASSQFFQKRWPGDSTYQTIVDYMRNWTEERIAYLDELYLESTPNEDSPTPINPVPEPPNNNTGGGGGGSVKPDPAPADDPEPSDDPAPEPNPQPSLEFLFEDVPDDAYYNDPVKWAVSGGVTNGIDETHFGPDLSCTRAQMVTFLWRAAGSPEPGSADNPFTDVEAGSYYEKAVLWAVEKEITNGTSETTFSPDMTVTRGQSVTFLYRFAGEKTNAAVPFEDVEESAYYEEAIQWAVSAEVTKGTSETTFEPKSPCTRAQIVTFLYRTMAE